jgi:hypothetical protein
MTRKQNVAVFMSAVTVLLGGTARSAAALPSCFGRYDVCGVDDICNGSQQMYQLQCHQATGCGNVPLDIVCMALDVNCGDGQGLACFY